MTRIYGDACLYAFTHCFNFHNAGTIPVKKTPEQEWKEEEKRMIERAVAKATRKDQDEFSYNEPDWLTRDPE